MFHDLRYGIRMLFSKPAIALIAISTLALGIAASATIFSVTDAVLLRPLPFTESDQLVLMREVGARGGNMSVAEPNFEDVKNRSTSFKALALIGGGNLVVTGGSEAVRTRVSYASGQFFDAIGVQPVMGRTFSAEEMNFGGPRTVVVSHSYWQRQLAGNPDLDSVKLSVDGVNCSVVGVMPEGFGYPNDTQVWITRGVEPPSTSRTAHNWPIIGRLKPGVSIEQARADVGRIAQQLKQTHGASMNAVDFSLVPLQEYLARNIRSGLLLLLGAAGILLLVACANVSNLLLTRFTARRREFTIRIALGITRWRLFRQLLAETMLVTVPAAIVGVMIAGYGIDLLLYLDPGNLPRTNLPDVDARVLAFALSLALVIALGLSLLTTLKLGRSAAQSNLRQAGPSSDRASLRLRHGLAISQVALTLVLLTGAGLLANSFLRLLKTDPGFDTGSAVTMKLALPSTISVDEDEGLRQFYVQLLERLSVIPGVTAVGGINALPLDGAGGNGTFLIDDDPAQRGSASYRVASAGYFKALNIRLLKGRYFGPEDTVNSPHVALISQSLAKKYWPNDDAIGKRLQFGNMDRDRRLLHIVGVVGDVKSYGLDTEADGTVYSFSLQRPQWWQVSSLSIVVRSSASASTLIPEMRRAVTDLRPDVPLSFRTLDEVLSASLDQRRFSAVLFGIFAVVALLIATIGIYGVISYGVAQRTNELGIRMALGARAVDVIRLVIGEGLRMIVIGVGLGLIGSIALTRLLSSLVYGVSVTDPLTFAAVSFGLVLVALAASYLPARRATKVDPLLALRQD